MFFFQNDSYEVANINYSFDYFFAVFYYEFRHFYTVQLLAFFDLSTMKIVCAGLKFLFLNSKDVVYGDGNRDLSPGDAVGSILKNIYTY